MIVLIQQLIVEIQIQVSWGVIIFEDNPHQGSTSRSENNKSFRNRQFKQSFQGVLSVLLQIILIPLTNKFY